MCLYLTKRGSTYYFRRVIPVELRPAFAGAGEFMFSLRTKDKEEAKRKRSAEALRTDQLLDEARARLGHATAPEAPPARPMRGLGEDEAEQLGWERREDAEQEARWESREELRQRLEKRLRLSTAEITPEEAAMRDILRDREYEFTIREERAMARRVARAEERRGVSAPAASAVALAAASGGSQRGHSAAMLDAEIVDMWAAERKVVRKGVDTHRAVARWFYERVGRKPVGEITRKDVLAFKDRLVEAGQSAANTNMKLSRLRTLLQWAEDNDYAAANPAKGIKLKDTDAAKNKRREFDLPALKAIFSSPVFAEGARPAGGKGEAAYWLPLLALYTGARLEELGQLRPTDVVQERYPDATGAEAVGWFIRIVEDAAAGLRLKNAASERRVPVHPELERLGFLAHASAARESGRARLFPELKPNVYGRLTAKWGEWFSSYLRNVCGVRDRRLVFHSFRHTFKHYARHAGLNEGVQRQIMGHSSGDVADDYGSGHSLHRLSEGMRMFRVPGMILPAPPPAYRPV